jgi:hypothetical protein
MKKKLKPDEQSKELQKALWEFFKRNKGKFSEFLEEEKIGSVSDLAERFNTSEEEMEDHLSDLMAKPAIVDDDPCYKAFSKAFDRAEKKHDLWKQIPYTPYEVIKDEKQFSDLYLEELVRDSENIIKKYMSDRPLDRYLISIDLSRSTEVILSEIKAKVKIAKNEKNEPRLKWLATVPELLEVWDLYELAGQFPGPMSFERIARKVGRPLSTVKSQWRLAYEKIYGKAYDPGTKYANEETRALADAFCAKCPYNGKCYRNGDIYPCAEYMKIAGKEKPEPKHLEFKDEIYK